MRNTGQRFQLAAGGWLEGVSRKHPSWKWGPFGRLSQLTRHHLHFNPLEGALAPSVRGNLIGVAHMSIFHSASADALFEPLCHCLNRHKQLSPFGAPWKGPHADLATFLGNIPFSPAQSANLGIFEASRPLAAQVERLWVSIHQLSSSFLVMCVFGVANGSKRRNASTLLSKKMEEEVRWRLVLRPRVQVLPSYGSVSAARRKAIRSTEQDIGSSLAEAFSTVRDHIVGELLIPCWSIDSPDGLIEEAIEEDIWEQLLDPWIGMWIDEWLVVGFHESCRRWEDLDTPWKRSPRVVVDQALFKKREELGMYLSLIHI